MSELSLDTLEKLFGKDFVQKYQTALAKAQEVPKEKLEKIREFALTSMKSSDNFYIKFENLDVILAQAPRDPSKFPPKKTNRGNTKVTMIWPGGKSLRGPFISVFCSTREDAEKLTEKPEKVYLLVGKLQERNYEGDTTYSFRCNGVVDPEVLQ